MEGLRHQTAERKAGGLQERQADRKGDGVVHHHPAHTLVAVHQHAWVEFERATRPDVADLEKSAAVVEEPDAVRNDARYSPTSSSTQSAPMPSVRAQICSEICSVERTLA